MHIPGAQRACRVSMQLHALSIYLRTGRPAGREAEAERAVGRLLGERSVSGRSEQQEEDNACPVYAPVATEQNSQANNYASCMPRKSWLRLGAMHIICTYSLYAACCLPIGCRPRPDFNFLVSPPGSGSPLRFAPAD
jgi:hypothetical protein